MSMLPCSGKVCRAADRSVTSLSMTGAIAHLWKAHAQRNASRGTDDSATLQAAKATSVAAEGAFPPNKKRKRTSDHTSKAANQSPAKGPKSRAREIRAGETNLGSGSVVIIEPRAFKQIESQQLYTALKVSQNCVIQLQAANLSA